MAQSIPAHKYKPRAVSAVRTFPKGCGRAAAAAAAVVTPIKSAPPSPVAESTTLDTVSFPDSAAAAVTPMKPPSPPPVSESATPDTVTSLDAAITPLKSPPTDVSESAAPDPVNFLDSEIKRNGSFLNPNRFRFPKRRKVSATRTFPAGCGRPKLKNLGKEPEPDKMDVDMSQEEPHPMEQSENLEIVTHGAITVVPNTCTDIISLEEPKPLNVDESSKRETGVRPLQEAKSTHIVKSGIYGDAPMTKKKKAVVGQVQKRVQEPKLKTSERQEQTKPSAQSGSRVAITSRIEKEEAVGDRLIVQCLMAAPNCPWRVGGLREENKPRAQSGGRSAGKVSTLKQTQSSEAEEAVSTIPGNGSILKLKQHGEAEEAVGDRVIVQCLMAASNCPWRSGSKSTTPKFPRSMSKQLLKRKFGMPSLLASIQFIRYDILGADVEADKLELKGGILVLEDCSTYYGLFGRRAMPLSS